MRYRWTASSLLAAVAAVAAVAAAMAPLARTSSSPPRTGRNGSAAPATTTTGPATRTPTTATPPAPAAKLRSLPDVVGETLAEAEKSITDAGVPTRVQVTAATVDLSVPAETIVAQTGTHLTVAVPSDKFCARTQVVVTYQFNQGAMGNVLAGLIVRNASSTWCAIPGPFHVLGVSQAGAPATNTLVVSLSDPAADVLSPDTPPVPDTESFTGSGVGDAYPVDVLFAYLGFAGPHNTCATDVPGSSQPRVTPVAWRVTFSQGFAVTVPNGTPQDATEPPSTTDRVRSPFSSCGGAIQSVHATVR
jgi:hypothetical protein